MLLSIFMPFKCTPFIHGYCQLLRICHISCHVCLAQHLSLIDHVPLMDQNGGIIYPLIRCLQPLNSRPPANQHRGDHPRQGKTAESSGRALPCAVCNPERSDVSVIDQLPYQSRKSSAKPSILLPAESDDDSPNEVHPMSSPYATTKATKEM